MRPSPDPAVEVWVGDPPATDLYFSAVGEAELRYGVAIMPPGRRRMVLASAIEAIIREDFAERILPFDSGAARAYAERASGGRHAGRPAGEADCQIAAIARSRGMAVITRNVRDFKDINIEVGDPWVAA